MSETDNSPEKHIRKKALTNLAAKIITYQLFLIWDKNSEKPLHPEEIYSKEIPDALTVVVDKLNLSDKDIDAINHAYDASAFKDNDSVFGFCKILAGIYNHLEASGMLERLLQVSKVKADPAGAVDRILQLERQIEELQAQHGVDSDPIVQSNIESVERSGAVEDVAGDAETNAQLVKVLCTPIDSSLLGLSPKTAALLKNDGLRHVIDIVEGKEEEVFGILNNSRDMLAEVTVMLTRQGLSIGMELDKATIEAVAAEDLDDIPF